MLLAIGIAARLRSARLLAIGIFGVTLIKMVGGDLWSIGPIHRIVSFAGIGALLLACSLLFHRVKHVVLGERDGAGLAAARATRVTVPPSVGVQLGPVGR